MRCVAGVLALALSAGCASSTRAPASPSGSSSPLFVPGPGSSVDWIPPYSPQQLALLRPTNHTVDARATRVMPDLARFSYSDNRPITGPEEAIRFTRMVVAVLDQSPRYYVVEQADPSLANPIVQYGPAPSAPDGWKILRRDSAGGDTTAAQPSHAAGLLAEAEGRAEARGDVEAAEAREKAADFGGAITAWRAAVAKTRDAPGPRAALGNALAQSGDVAGAKAAFDDAIRVDPSYAPAHVGLAELAEKRGDAAVARHQIIEALAYDPPSPRAQAIAMQFAAGASRPGTYPIFLDVDPAGAVHAATTGSVPAQMYAGCRAMMRYEPSVRAQLFTQPPDVPYYLSVVEEVVCTEAAIGAYVLDRSDADGGPEDATADALISLAREEGLSGYAMFELIGQHRPESARAAPPEVHKAMVQYLEHYLLGRRPPPAGSLTASKASTTWGPRDEPTLVRVFSGERG